MGEDGVRGPTGLTGLTGPSGIPGISEANISVFTGGSLGTLGSLFNVDLSGNNSVGIPGTHPDTWTGQRFGYVAGDPSADVRAGTAKRLFVNVDNDPGTQMNTGIPSTFSFFLCNGQFAGPGSTNCGSFAS